MLLSVLADPGRALAEFNRVLKPGGRLAVSDVYVRDVRGAWDRRRLRLENCLTGAPSWDELTERVEAAGFAILLWEDHSRLLAEPAARLILADVAPAVPAGGFIRQGADIRDVIEKSRPGYLLLVARRPA